MAELTPARTAGGRDLLDAASQDRRRSIAVDGTEVSDGDRRGGHGLGISAVSPRDDGDDDGLAGSPRTKDLDTFAQVRPCESELTSWSPQLHIPVQASHAILWRADPNSDPPWPLDDASTLCLI